MDDLLLSAIRALVADLARGRYREIEADGRAGRLTASDLRAAILRHGERLAPLPEDAVALIEVYPSESDATRLSLDVALWTVDETPSDLTLSLVATRHEGSAPFRLEVTDLHVL